MADPIKGRRVADGTEFYAPGDYGCGADGVWRGWPPDSEIGVGNFGKHEVTEHADGTITVSPSIEISRGDDTPVWHGFLEAGYWRKA